ncbi:MAG: NAD(P)/FAD-dependent oxidoreductase [Spirochaetota bacterium]|nr:NAD(P)/FAD-dependent oxidoreductase [Spirochaetota bacterium]
MVQTEVAIVGAGPAGLSAAIECARAGAKVTLIDENAKPGGQLFKQIHKFFGSREHRAGIRGIRIGEQLLEEAKELNIDVWLNAEVCGIYRGSELWVVVNHSESRLVKARAIILATGATENAVSFDGWSLPGVMGAGAAQTMINLHRVLPGKRVLMIGSGNVGVIVSYQLLQAGAEVAAIVEAAPRLGGYGVHTAKVRRAGVPFYTSHTVLEARGSDHVESAVIVQLDDRWQPVPGTEKEFEVDTICIAAGLTPLIELAAGAGCGTCYIPALGGHIPMHDEKMRTSLATVFVAGDIAGVEEASTAMEEGRLAGIHAAAALGHYSTEEEKRRSEQVWQRLATLRSGPFGQKRREAKNDILNLRRALGERMQ